MNEKQAFGAGLKAIQANNYDLLKKVFSYLMKGSHFLYVERLFIERLKTPLDEKSGLMFVSVINFLIKKGQKKIVQSIKTKLEKTDDIICQSILTKVGSNTDTISKERFSNHEKIDATQLASRDIKSAASKSDTQSTSVDNNDTFGDEAKEQFKLFYWSFLVDPVQSLLVSCEKKSSLGTYYIKITKSQIDFRKIESGKEKKFIYNFDSAVLTIDGQKMPNDYFNKFYKIMEKVSKDVKSNVANLYEERG